MTEERGDLQPLGCSLAQTLVDHELQPGKCAYVNNEGAQNQ